MIYKTNGLVLNYIRFRETSIICKIFTESFGLQAYIINSIRKSKSRNISLFQPLNSLELIVYQKKTSDIQRIKEVKIKNIYKTIHTDIKKMSMCFFLSEFLTKVLNNEENQYDKFEFINNSLLCLDSMRNHYSNFHVQFLIKFIKFFGFEITSHRQILGLNNSDKGLTEFVEQCVKNKYDIKIDSNNILRNKVINLLLEYYSQNLEISINLKSANVLKQVFNR